MKIKIFAFSFVFLFASAYAQEQLIFAVDLIRHGARTPFIDNITTPAYQWSQGLGQLTPQGMQQVYQLGVQKRQQYVEQMHLLPATYQAGLVYARATDYDRTLMSASIFLLGLYPLGTGPWLTDGSPALPEQFQPVPVHSMGSKNDQLFTPLSWVARKILLKQYVFNSQDWQDKQAALMPKFQAWSQATGWPITSLSQLITLGDTLSIRQDNKAPMPAGLSSADVKLIIDSGSWALARSYQPHVIAHAAAHNLLMQLDQYLVAASQQQAPLKYVLWSAHDTTLLALLSDLYAPLSAQVPYAADVNFMLFKDDHDQYIVKVTYNGQPVKIPACHQSNVCTLSQFVAIDHSVF